MVYDRCSGGKGRRGSGRGRWYVLVRFLSVPEMGGEVVCAVAELDGEDLVHFCGVSCSFMGWKGEGRKIGRVSDGQSGLMGLCFCRR